MFLCAASICVSYLKKFPESLSSPLLTDPKLLLLFIKFLKLSHPITIRVRSPFPSKPKKIKTQWSLPSLYRSLRMSKPDCLPWFLATLNDREVNACLDHPDQQLGIRCFLCRLVGPGPRSLAAWACQSNIWVSSTPCHYPEVSASAHEAENPGEPSEPIYACFYST